MVILGDWVPVSHQGPSWEIQMALVSGAPAPITSCSCCEEAQSILHSFWDSAKHRALAALLAPGQGISVRV